MPDFGAILQNIGRPLAQTVAAHNFAETAEDDKRRQEAMQAYAMQRQNSLDRNTKALQDSQIARNTHLANPATKWQRVTTDKGLFEWNPETNDTRPINEPTPPAPPTGSSAPPSEAPSLGLLGDDTPQGPQGGQGGPQQPTTPPAPKVMQPRPPAPKAPAADPLVKVVKNGQTTWLPRSQASGMNAPTPTGPTPDRTLVQTVGPDGQPVYTKRADAVGKAVPTKGVTGAGGMGTGSGGIGGLARTSAAITGMAQAEPLMTAFENDPNRRLDGLDYWQKMRASMYDAKGIKDEAAHAAIYAHLNQQNPGLANYLRNAETWALEDSQLSGRGSDFRTKLDGFISQIGPNAGPEQTQNTQKFRKTRLAELQRFQPAMQAIGDRIAGGRGGGRGSTLSPGDKPGNIDLSATGSGDPEFDALMAKVKKRTP